MDEKILPPGWGKDSLSEFIENAHHNSLATFVNLKPQFIWLTRINDDFKKITENMKNTPEFIPSLLLFRAHASYLGAIRLAVSGQIPETYMVLRGCIENSLYALHIARFPKAGENWIKRHDNEESLKQCKKNFEVGNVLKTLNINDKKLYKTTKKLYETTIDYGGHPNEMSLTSIITKRKDGSDYDFKIAYLASYKINKLAFALCLKSTARIGLCSLMIFKLIFKERFDILGISNDLEKLKQGL